MPGPWGSAQRLHNLDLCHFYLHLIKTFSLAKVPFLHFLLNEDEVHLIFISGLERKLGMMPLRSESGKCGKYVE